MNHFILMLSPHPDDICFSMGGTLLQMSKEKTYIWTVFSEKTFTCLNIYKENIKQKILDEDKKAMSKINQNYSLGGYKEAKLRDYKFLSQIIGKDIDIKGTMLKEKKMISDIKLELSCLKKQYSPQYVGVPIGIGNHIDHLIVRETALDVFSDSAVIFFYEDMPYSVHKEWYENGIAEVKARYYLTENRTYVTELLEEKKKLMECYHSQLTKRDQKLMYAYFDTCRDQIGFYERFWLVDK